MVDTLIAPPKVRIHTLAEYFEFEYRSEERHEFWDGLFSAMPYTSTRHGRITRNLNWRLADRLDETDSEVFAETRMVYIKTANRVYYPDIVVVTGVHEYYEYKAKNIKATTNPSVVIEVLSNSTERFDKTKKWAHYQTLESLKQYILVSQNEVKVDTYVLADGEWIHSTFKQLDDVISIEGVNVSLAEIYRKVDEQ